MRQAGKLAAIAPVTDWAGQHEASTRFQTSSRPLVVLEHSADFDHYFPHTLMGGAVHL